MAEDTQKQEENQEEDKKPTGQAEDVESVQDEEEKIEDNKGEETLYNIFSTLTKISELLEKISLSTEVKPESTPEVDPELKEIKDNITF